MRFMRPLALALDFGFSSQNNFSSTKGIVVPTADMGSPVETIKRSREYWSRDVVFSGFADEPAENASGVAYLAWLDQAESSKPYVSAEKTGHFS